jgi:hypothetical protein
VTNNEINSSGLQEGGTTYGTSAQRINKGVSSGQQDIVIGETGRMTTPT